MNVSSARVAIMCFNILIQIELNKQRNSVVVCYFNFTFAKINLFIHDYITKKIERNHLAYFFSCFGTYCFDINH
jgi:hypothetical protein